MTENCLTLNIFVPRDLRSNSSEKLTVMIWVHGGRYRGGSATGYHGDVLSVIGDVIVETINYRLAKLGFLIVGDTGQRVTKVFGINISRSNV